jgi:hypothetical protein
MSAVADLLGAIIEALDLDDVTESDLLSRLASIDADRVDQYALDETVTSHETALDDGADGITFTTVRQSRPSSVFIAWEGVAGVSGHGYYELQFSTSASEAGLVYTVQQQSTWHITDALAFGTTYYVRGRAVDAAGHQGAWGAWASLTSLQTVTDDMADDAVTTAKIANLAVTNAKIDTLSASKITAGTISAQTITLGTAGSDGVLKSSVFTAGSAGWQIDGSGNAEFNNLTARGTLETEGSTALTFSTGQAAEDGPGEMFANEGFTLSATRPFIQVESPHYHSHAGTQAVLRLWARNDSGSSPAVAELICDRLILGNTGTTAGYTSYQALLTIDSAGLTIDPDHGTTTGRVTITSDLDIDGDINHDGSNIGFFGEAPNSKQTVTGSRGGNAALASLLTALASYGLITDSST